MKLEAAIKSLTDSVVSKEWAYGPAVRAVLDALAAERQQTENANAGWLKAIDERDTAKQKANNFENVAYGLAAEKEAAEKERDAMSEALIIYGDEIQDLRNKLANPVVLSDCSIEAVSHMAHWYSEGECVAWVAGAEHVKKQIVVAGFPVREE